MRQLIFGQLSQTISWFCLAYARAHYAYPRTQEAIETVDTVDIVDIITINYLNYLKYLKYLTLHARACARSKTYTARACTRGQNFKLQIKLEYKTAEAKIK